MKTAASSRASWGGMESPARGAGDPVSDAGASGGIGLFEDSVHDARSQQDFTIRYGQRRVLIDGIVERLDEILHAFLHMEIVRQKQPYIRQEFSAYWRARVSGVTKCSR